MAVLVLPRRRAVALAITMALASAGADAATLTVSSTQDGPVTADAICTLREALVSISNAAVAGGCTATGAFGTADAVTITATGTITLAPTEGPLIADSPSTITGPGAAQLTISGNNAVPVLYAYGPGIAVSGVTIANGDSGSPGAGGVTAFYSSVALSNCTISGNTGGYGGAIVAVYSGVTVTNCTVSGNTGAQGGGITFLSGGGQITGSTLTGNNSGAPPTGVQRPGNAFWNSRERERLHVRRAPDGAPGLGGALSAFGDFGGKRPPGGEGGGPQLSITRSTISGNTAALIGGGLFLYATSTQITDSTISGNTAGSAGGGAIVLQSPFGIANSTVSGNTATGSGPGTGGGGLLLYGSGGVPANLASTTITGNTAATGAGGVLVDSAVAVTIGSTILANSLGAAPADIGTLNQGFTFAVTNSLVEGVGNSGITATGGNLIGVDPQLGPLANNGGPTFTHLPGATSPVLNVGSNPTAAAFDQRGTPFARVVGAAADIGSIEVPAGGPPPTPSFVANVPTTTTWGGLLLASALAALAWLRRPRPARRRK